MVSRCAAIVRASDSRSTVKWVVGQRNVRLFGVVHRNDLKGGPAPVNDREARAFPHALDDVGKGGTEALRINRNVHLKLKVNSS
jgi:hypothetical protein